MDGRSFDVSVIYDSKTHSNLISSHGYSVSGAAAETSAVRSDVFVNVILGGPQLVGYSVRDTNGFATTLTSNYVIL